jgi:hypothetical protein
MVPWAWWPAVARSVEIEPGAGLPSILRFPGDADPNRVAHPHVRQVPSLHHGVDRRRANPQDGCRLLHREQPRLVTASRAGDANLIPGSGSLRHRRL